MKKLFSFILIIAMVLSVSGVALAANMDFTDASANENGTGWTWDNDSKTLTLSGVAIIESVVLPKDSKIIVTAGTENSIIVAGAAPITTSGTLNISGAGKLTITAEDENTYHTIQGAEKIAVDGTELTTYGYAGLAARNVEISNANINIRGYGYGFYYNGTTGSSTVTLTNVSGSIIGELDCGIDMYMEYNADNTESDKDVLGVYIKDCSELTIKGEPARTDSNGNGHRSAIRVFTKDAETDCVVEIDNSTLDMSGSGGGIFVNSHSDNSASDDASSASVKITDSTVDIETKTNTWAAIFANNNGTGAKATASIDISDSTVKALCPNDVAIMTSTKDADSTVTVDGSTVEMAGKYAGIRAKAINSDAGEATVKNSSILVVTGEIANNYNSIDEMDNATSSDGSSGVSDDSMIIMPVDGTEITINPDGTVTVPKGGKVKINNGEVKEYPEGATFKSFRAMQSNPGPKPSSSSGISVTYNGGNSFSTSNSAVPTSVEIDGVAVPFIGNGSSFTVGCIEPNAKWVTVKWNSTSVTTNFTPDGNVVCTEVMIPKTGDVSIWSAIAAFLGL